MNTNNKSNYSKIVAGLMLCLFLIMTTFALNLVTANNEIKNNVCVVNNNVNDGISTYGIIDNIGNGGEGTLDKPYYDVDWYGRVKVEHYIGVFNGLNHYIEINIDPRRAPFVDDIIVEYKFYSRSSTFGFKNYVKLNFFEAYIEYYVPGSVKPITDYVSKSNDDKAGFTKNSGKNNVYMVKVKCGVTHNNKHSDIYFKFG